MWESTLFNVIVEFSDLSVGYLKSTQYKLIVYIFWLLADTFLVETDL